MTMNQLIIWRAPPCTWLVVDGDRHDGFAKKKTFQTGRYTVYISLKKTNF